MLPSPYLSLSGLSFAGGQITLLEEDFSTALGTTPPSGWTIQTVVGDPAVDVWHFDKPGRCSPATPISSPYALFDSDKYRNNSLAEECSYAMSNSIEVVVSDAPEKLVISANETQLCEGESAQLEVNDLPGLSYLWMDDGVPVTGGTGPAYSTDRSGIYDVEIENADGCVAMSNNPLSVKVYESPPKPDLSEKYSRTEICPGESVTFQLHNHSEIYTYSWLKNGLAMNNEGAELSGSLKENRIVRPLIVE